MKPTGSSKVLSDGSVQTKGQQLIRSCLLHRVLALTRVEAESVRLPDKPASFFNVFRYLEWTTGGIMSGYPRGSEWQWDGSTYTIFVFKQSVWFIRRV